MAESDSPYEQILNGIEITFQKKLDEIRTLKVENGNHQARLRQESAKSQQYLEERQVLEKSVATLTTLADVSAKRNRELQKMADDLKSAQEQLTKRTEELTSKLRVAEATCNNLKTAVESQDRDLAVLRLKFDHSTRAHEAKLQLHDANHRRELDTKDSTIQALQREIREKETKLRAEEAAHRTLIDRMEAQRQELTMQADSVKRKYEETMVSLVAEAGKVGNSQTDLLKQKIMMLKSELATLKGNIEKDKEAQKQQRASKPPVFPVPPSKRANLSESSSSGSGSGTARKTKLAKTPRRPSDPKASTPGSIYDFYED